MEYENYLNKIKRRKVINIIIAIFETIYIIFSIIRLTGTLNQYYTLIIKLEIVSIVLATIGLFNRPIIKRKDKLDNIVSILIYISFVLALIKLFVLE